NVVFGLREDDSVSMFLGGVVAAALLAVLEAVFPRRQDAELRRGAWGVAAFAACCLSLVCSWTALTVFDAEFPARVLRGYPRPTREFDPDKSDVAVCLSGGGYRATVFHNGVLEALEEAGAPVCALTSVSGGSISAAFFESGGSPKRLTDAIVSGRLSL